MDPRRWGLLLALQTLGVLLAAAIEVHTPGELEAANGTDTRLKCTFSSSVPVSNKLYVEWTFTPEAGGASVQVFHYQEQPFLPESGTFRGRAVWDGNINRKDVSIMIRDLQHSDSGTFMCQVRNPPDVSGLAGEIQLRVVNKGLTRKWADAGRMHLRCHLVRNVHLGLCSGWGLCRYHHTGAGGGADKISDEEQKKEHRDIHDREQREGDGEGENDGFFRHWPLADMVFDEN